MTADMLFLLYSTPPSRQVPRAGRAVLASHIQGEKGKKKSHMLAESPISPEEREEMTKKNTGMLGAAEQLQSRAMKQGHRLCAECCRIHPGEGASLGSLRWLGTVELWDLPADLRHRLPTRSHPSGVDIQLDFFRLFFITSTTPTHP